MLRTRYFYRSSRHHPRKRKKPIIRSRSSLEEQHIRRLVLLILGMAALIALVLGFIIWLLFY